MKKFTFLFCAVLFHLALFNNYASFAEDFCTTENVIVSDLSLFIEGIDKAQDYIFLGTYKIHDYLLPNKKIIDALKRAAQRGVRVTLLIEKNLTDPEKKEGDGTVHKGDSLLAYQKLGIYLVECPQKYKASHLKILLADDKYAFVGTTNFDKKFSTEEGITRDFSIIVRDPGVIKELKSVLLADAKNQTIPLPDYRVQDITTGYKLTWGPEQHRKHFLEIIDSAKKSLDIYQQDLQDTEIVDHLIKASNRGVALRILMSKYPFGSKHGNKNAALQQKICANHGYVKLTPSPPLHIHAKVMIIDGQEKEAVMYLGSSNFFPDAMNKDRQVGLITKDKGHIHRVLDVFEKDWKSTPPF